jgi:hypothetical protein
MNSSGSPICWNFNDRIRKAANGVIHQPAGS